MTKRELTELEKEIANATDRVNFTRDNYPSELEWWRGYENALKLFRLRCITKFKNTSSL